MTAFEVLTAKSFEIADLPIDPTSAVWQLLQDHLGLTIGQLCALQKFVVEKQKPVAKAPSSKKPTGGRKGKIEKVSSDAEVIVIRDSEENGAYSNRQMSAVSSRAATPSLPPKQLFEPYSG